jgi:hypothetical protein
LSVYVFECKADDGIVEPVSIVEQQLVARSHGALIIRKHTLVYK